MKMSHHTTSRGVTVVALGLFLLSCEALANDSTRKKENSFVDLQEFVAVPPYEAGTPDWYCVNWSVDSFGVSLSSDRSQIIIQRDPGYRPRPLFYRVNDGWLASFDRGEFGSYIWWLSDTGAQPVHVSNEHLLAFVPTKDGLFGVAGFSHLYVGEGRILKFNKPANGQWSVSTILDLGAAPRAYAQVSDNTLLVATAAGLVKVELPDHQTVLHKSRGVYSLAPTSLVRDKSGIIYMGMRYGVARLTPTSQGYHEEWLVPKSCPRLKRTDEQFKCQCVGAE